MAGHRGGRLADRRAINFGAGAGSLTGQTGGAVAARGPHADPQVDRALALVLEEFRHEGVGSGPSPVCAGWTDLDGWATTRRAGWARVTRRSEKLATPPAALAVGVGGRRHNVCLCCTSASIAC